MKNKEIKEMIKNRIEDIYQSGEYIYQAKELEEILSYIERLEKENKILKENAEHNDKVVDKVNWEIKMLKNNRDKAIEFLKTEHMTYDSAWQWRQALINILKGGSDE